MGILNAGDPSCCMEQHWDNPKGGHFAQDERIGTFTLGIVGQNGGVPGIKDTSRYKVSSYRSHSTTTA